MKRTLSMPRRPAAMAAPGRDHMTTATATVATADDRRRIRWADLAPFIALAVIVILGALINSNFTSSANLINVITRSAFIAIIAVGATFVISSGGLDLSVG